MMRTSATTQDMYTSEVKFVRLRPMQTEREREGDTRPHKGNGFNYAPRPPSRNEDIAVTTSAQSRSPFSNEDGLRLSGVLVAEESVNRFHTRTSLSLSIGTEDRHRSRILFFSRCKSDY